MTTPTAKIVQELIACGVCAETIVAVSNLIADADQTAARRQRNRERMRFVRTHAHTEPCAHTDVHVRTPPPHTPPLPSRLEPCGSNLSGRATTKRKVPLPDDWNPVILEADAAELERFKDYAKANGKLYADWNAAWRNWRTSPYRKPNGGHRNGSGQHETLAEQTQRLADACREREQKLGPGLFGTPNDVASGRSRR